MNFEEKIDTHSQLEKELEELETRRRELSSKARKIEIDLRKNSITQTKDFKSYKEFQREDGMILRIEPSRKNGDREFKINGHTYSARAPYTLIVELAARKAFDDGKYVNYDHTSFRKIEWK